MIHEHHLLLAISGLLMESHSRENYPHLHEAHDALVEHMRSQHMQSHEFVSAMESAPQV